MKEEVKQVPGYEIGKITTMEKFRNIMINLFKGYPAYTYFGIFETHFGKNAERVIKKLQNDDLIEVDYDIKNKIYYYSLTSKGIDFAISMINLEYSEKTNSLTKRITILTLAMLGVILTQLTLTLIQIYIMINLG